MINNRSPRALQLELSDIWGADILYPFRIRGIKCPISYLGALINDRSSYRLDNDYVITKQGMGFNATPYRLNEGFCVDYNGNIIKCPDDLYVPVRVKWRWSEIKDYCINVERASDSVLEADYGLWFSRTYLEEEYLLEGMYQSNTGLKNSNLSLSVMFGSGNIDNYVVMDCDGTLYSRLEFVGEENSLGAVWCRVSSIHLWIDEERDIAVSEEAIVVFGKNTDVVNYLDKYFSSEVFSGALVVEDCYEKRKSLKLVRTLYRDYL